MYTLDIINDYTAKAEAKTTQAVGGVDASLIGAETNVAKASVGTLAEAGICGKGEINVVGKLNVNIDGTAKAEAGIASSTVKLSGISIAANAVDAELLAKQYAFIEDADVTAGNVGIISRFNTDGSGALAQLGSVTTGGLDVSLVGASANVAHAKANATSHAYASGASINAGNGTINISSQATSMATADVVLPSGSIGLVSIGVNELQANAGGSYNAYLNGAAGSIIAGQLNINNNYTARANARTGASTQGVSVSGGTVTVSATQAAQGGLSSNVTYQWIAVGTE